MQAVDETHKITCRYSEIIVNLRNNSMYTSRNTLYSLPSLTLKLPAKKRKSHKTICRKTQQFVNSTRKSSTI